MPICRIGGVGLNVERHGTGQPVLLVSGSGAAGRVWKAHQVPALIAAGYQAITLDNRGIAPSAGTDGGFTLQDMVNDTAGLITELGIGPCRAAGSSLGALILQEVMVSHPGLVGEAVLMATRGRADALSDAMTEGEIELAGSGIRLPLRYAAYIQAIQYLSPSTLADETVARDWLELLELTAADAKPNHAQVGLEMIPDRLGAYRQITARCLVVAFADDVITRPLLCREVAGAIPGCGYLEIADCGHYGYLEDPAAVNDAMLGFFAGQERADAGRAPGASPSQPPRAASG